MPSIYYEDSVSSKNDFGLVLNKLKLDKHKDKLINEITKL